MDTRLYEIKKSETLGRYLVALRPIKAGEVIIHELPVAFGPPTSSEPVCLGCNKKVSFYETPYRCPGCHWPICNPQCEGLNKDLGHSRIECQLFAQNNVAKLVEKFDGRQMKIGNEIIFPLRCLYLKQTNPDKWAQTIALESHNDLRKDIPELWSRNQEKIVNQIRDDWNIKEFTDEEIHTVSGIIKVNCFGLGRQGTKGRALYPLTSIMAHDCCPNVRTAIHPKTYTMTVRALRDIEQGESITTSYVDYIMGTMKRREQLKHGKFFWCICRRCRDPTEFGTYCSALKCLRCNGGTVLSTNPLDQDAEWMCLQCQNFINASTISATLDKLFRELESTDATQIQSLEDFIQKYKRILGDKHYLITLAKYNICQLYNMSNDFSVDTLRQREQYCRDVLEVVNVLKPGLSLVRAITMFNLHIPLLSLAKIAFKKGEINIFEFRLRLQEAVELLNECEVILKLDPDDPMERDMANLAAMALKAINQVLIIPGKIMERRLYEICISDTIGRYLTATQPIKAGEVIINEIPVAFSTPKCGDLFCLGCYKKLPLSGSQNRCSGCQWPICSEQCEGLYSNLGHSQFECELFSRKNIRLIDNFDEKHTKTVNGVMFPLRCLYLKYTDQAKWAAAIAMESHRDIRKEIPAIHFHEQKMVNQIRDIWGIREFTEDEIYTVSGIIEVNCFGFDRDGRKGRGLYPITSLMAHDCCPNVRTAIHPKTYAMTARALRDIEQGESLTISYVDYILGTLKRREQLKHGKLFWCTCQRCADPTEFGTYCSALKCRKCQTGIVLPINPLKQDAPWACLQCTSSIDAATISAILDKLFRELEATDATQIQPFEDFIQKYKHILGEKHYLITLAKYNISQLYNLSNDFSVDVLKHREQYCRDVLEAVNVLKPGLSLVRAIAMFNLHIPLISLAKAAFKSQQISLTEFRNRVQEAAELLKECEHILKLDPDDAKERDMARLARIALVALSQLLMRYKN
ncbi:uncharacterized protein LOC119654024 [Hermetia illucens]|uniref:uncharacterized protein LOC119654024 n=1 Tax=Hermetia illucens TaxID=343691 RepID=UPI0018CC0C8C|nr:uncharacterized protein LOC119654024 [Hermetia illucens]